MSSEKYIGLDVHQATISVAVMDSQGKAGGPLKPGFGLSGDSGQLSLPANLAH